MRKFLFKTIIRNSIKSIAILLLLSTLNVAFAQDLLNIKTVATPEPLPTKEALTTELQATIEKLEASQKLLQAPELDTKSAVFIQNSQKVDQLSQIRQLLQQEIEIIDEIKQVKETYAETLVTLNNFQSPEHKKLIPKTFEESEKLRDEISVAKDLSNKTNVRLKNVRALLDQAKTNQQEQEKSLRQATNSLPEELKNAQDFSIETKQLDLKFANETLNLRRLEVELEKSIVKKNSSTLKLLNKRLDYASNSAQLNRADFQRRIAQIEETEQKLKIEQEQTKEELASANKTFREAKTKIEALPENTASDIDLEKLEAINNIRLFAQTRTRIITERLQRLAVVKDLWQNRYNNRLKNLQKEALIPLREKASVMLERLNREKSLQLTELDETRKKSAQIDEKLNNAETSSKQRVWIKDYKAAIDKLTRVYDENVVNIDSAISLHQNFIAETLKQVGGNSWNRVFEETTYTLVSIWNYELFSSGDYPVTVGSLFLGIILIILGYFASDLLSRKLIAKLLTRFNMTQGAIAAIQSLAFYLLLIAFALVALRIVNVPLTVFTVLGGALAIGVGFGSQNVMNNFISGLILLTEQPIRVGDMIEVDSHIGIVKKIGARSTIVRTGNNIDIVVPNSFFLEKNVINWTRNNSQARLNIAVKVDYNSNIEQVTQTLIKAAVENNKVLPSPKPFVWFTSYGDSSLNFELHFWVNVRSATEKSSIESEIRFEVNRLFNENKIFIAFTNRAAQNPKPLEVKLLGNS
jgi:potassium efflux system protein